MIRKRKRDDARHIGTTTHLDDLHAWVRSLPWVVERTPLRPLHDLHVRFFAVECEPLARRQVWLVTGLVPSLFEGTDVAVVMPQAAVPNAQERGWVTYADPLLPADHVLVALGRALPREHADVEELLLAGYCYALA
jgi:hypothetical protein